MINWFDVIFKLLDAFVNMCMPIIICIVVIILLFVFLVICWLVILHFKGYRFKKGTEKPTLDKRSSIEQLLIDFPCRVAKDIYNSNPDKFPDHGFIIFTGRQGNGKTSAMAKCLLDYRKEYPKLKIATNFGFKQEDKSITHWRDIVNFTNDIYGVVDAFDEIPSWFGSNASKDFPPEMLSECTQNRKNIRLMMGTAQNFYLVAKGIRSQCTEIRECMTILRCLCLVHKKEPILNDKGEVVKFKSRGWYFFVHTDELRECYDTYKIIQNLATVGFPSKSEYDINVSFTAEK